MKRYVAAWIIAAVALSLVSAARLDAATITSPTSGSTLTGSSVTFTWSSTDQATQYAVYAGSTQGGYDLGTANPGSSTSATLSSLPTDGRTVWIRLWSCASSTWTYTDTSFVAASSSTTTTTTAALTAPTPGSTLTGSSVTFTWSAGTGVTCYVLYLGSSQGAYDVSSARAGTATSVTMNGLPTDGRTLWVRLWTCSGTTWSYVDSQYVAASSSTTTTTTTDVSMTSPAPGSTLAGSSATFTWAQPSDVLENWVYVGSWRGASNIANSKSLGVATTYSATGLPVNGRYLFVRLFYRTSSGWAAKDFAYRAALTTVSMTSPTPGSTLTGTSVTFTWTQSSDVTENWMYVGTRRGTKDVYNSASLGLATTCTASSLPSDGRTLAVRLWYRSASGWAFKDYAYRASGSAMNLLNIDMEPH